MTIPFLAWPAAVVWVLSWFMSDDEPYRPPDTPAWVESIRHDFAHSVSRFGGDGSDLLPGLVLGDTSSVSDSLTDAMRTASLSHLTAVSGANCAVIVSLVFGLCALAGLGLWWRVAISIGALSAFVVLVGAEPSVVRAAIMAIIALVAIGIGRPVAGLTVVAATVLIALVFAPALSRSIGFALSVAATTGLLVLTAPLTQFLSRWLRPRFALVLAVPTAAQIAVQPLLLVFEPAFPTYGLVANALADPFAPIATVCGLLALLGAPIPLISLPLLWVAWLCSSIIAGIAHVASSLPFPLIPWPAGWVGIVTAAAASILVSWSLLASRAAPAVAAAVVVALSLSTTVGGSAVAWSRAPRDWQIAQCDVGQGDAIVVQSAGVFAMIDTGRDSGALRDCLRALGVDHIDVLFLTHFDIDHVGAYGVVLGKVGTVAHGIPDGAADQRILDDLEAGGARPVPVERGDAGRVGNWMWQVLWPTDRFPTEPGNPASVVLSFASDDRCPSCLAFVDLGDLPAREQGLMAGLGSIGVVDVVKVSHHGSFDQDPNLYARLRAAVGLIGVGATNTYGHPTDAALALVKSSGGLAVRSDESGISLVWQATDGSLRVWREKSP